MTNPKPKSGQISRRQLLWCAGLSVTAIPGSAAATYALAPKPPEKKRRPLRDVQKTYGGDIMKLSGVEGHGRGRKGKEDALIIYVKDARAKDHLDNLLSNNIEGYPVVFKVTGPIKARPL